MTTSRRRPRGLSGAELALWSKVVETVQPLAGRKRLEDAEAAEAVKADAPPVPPRQTSAAALPSRTKPAPAPALTPLAPLETRFRRRLARGVVAIDARIDLHGLRQDEAQRRLVGFLQGAQARGHKLVLVITGKGGPALADRDPFAERGVLRRAVPLWLSSPAARAVVVGFEPADPVHGGAGALYVRIRKQARG